MKLSQLVLVGSLVVIWAPPAFASPHEPDAPNRINCSACHGTHRADLDVARRPETCQGCHSADGAASALGPTLPHTVDVDGAPWTITCSTCHDPHSSKEMIDPRDGAVITNVAMLRPDIFIRAGFDDAPSAAPTSMDLAFSDADAPHDGVCQGCHTQTQFHAGLNGRGHGAGSRCTGCHPHALGFAAPEPGSGCQTCHPGPSSGAHAAHLQSTITIPMTCEDCHPPVITGLEATHMNGTPDVNMSQSARATLYGVTPSYDGARCADVFCHGAILSDTGNPAPRWDETGRDCSWCHTEVATGVLAPPGCVRCHSAVVDDEGIIAPNLHINGVLDFF